jgi:hypothetical protein
VPEPRRPVLDPTRRRTRRRIRWLLAVTLPASVGVLAAAVVFAPPLIVPAIVVVGAAMAFLVAGLITPGGGVGMVDPALGEDSTARILHRLLRHGFRIEHGIPLDGRRIDHALVGPRGVVAVETVFTHAEWTVTCGGVVETGAGGRRFAVPWPLAAARRAARDLRLLGIAGEVRTDVLPVAVIWGPRVAPIDGGARWVDGVLVAVGWQWREWLDLLAGGRLAEGKAERVWAAIQARKREHVDDTGAARAA